MWDRVHLPRVQDTTIYNVPKGGSSPQDLPEYPEGVHRPIQGQLSQYPNGIRHGPQGAPGFPDLLGPTRHGGKVWDIFCPSPFKGYHTITQGYPLSPIIFNVVVDTFI